MRRLGELARDGAALARLARDLPAFLRSPITPGLAGEAVRRRLETRAERFLTLAERAIYPNARSPYRRLLCAAGCELGDLRRLVAAEGLESAMSHLARAGVYVTFDELKGRAEAIRGSQRFLFSDAEFDNPCVRPHVFALTGGTRGRPTRVGRSLADLEVLAIDMALALAAHRLHDPEHVFWLTTPSLHFLLYARMGQRLRAWFYPLARLPWPTRVGAVYLAAVTQQAGVSIPRPRPLPLGAAGDLAEWLARTPSPKRPTCVSTMVSGAVRIAAAARDRGLGLGGVCFVVGSEPMTPARLETIQSTGARTIVKYGLMESGLVGMSCAVRRSPDDLHLFADRFAMTRRTRAVGRWGGAADAFLLTTLEPFAPKVLLNAETGDDGQVEHRACGCAMGEAGLTTHLSNIRSFEKLSGEGTTFATANLVGILEATLPARFGGSSTDYQLVEQEAPDGQTRTALLVSPRVGPIDAAEVRATFLARLDAQGEVERHMAAHWREVQAPDVQRREPIATPAGKIFPFHLARGEGPAE